MNEEKPAVAQLWGGPQDGFTSTVRVKQYAGPPEYVDVPEHPGTRPPDDLSPIPDYAKLSELPPPTVRYRLDAGYIGEHLLYRLERPVRQ